MAINKKLIHFKTKQKFNEELANGNILETSIVFILDTTEIYTHGQLYDGSTFDSSNIEASILDIITNKLDKTEAAATYLPKGNYALKSDVEDSDGVYAVNVNGLLIDYNTADSSCLGVALVKGDHKFMIAKSDATDGTNTAFRWTKSYTDLSLTNYGNADGTNNYGYLGGTSTPQLNKDFTTWKAGVLSDFNGKANTAIIAAAPSDDIAMCTVLNTFNASDSFKDWYIPACGQLALMYLNMTEINVALAKIGGTALAASNYWPSSEYSSTGAWYVDFSCGGVYGSFSKNQFCQVRFIRDISVKPLKERVTELESNKQDKNIYFTNVTANSWTSSTEYSDFKYKCDIACEGVTADMYAEVVFNVDQAVSGKYSPVCETGNGIVTIWSSVTDSITIPTIIITE